MSAACAGPPEQMGIGQTLAWTYYYGYLKLILPGFTDRVKRSRYWNEDSKNCKIVPKLFIILPDSCLCPPIVSEGDPMMTPGEHLEKFEAARAGNPRRSYTNFIYKLADHQDKEYFCVVEYATPLLTLYEMETGKLAGLTPEEKVKQRDAFKQTLEKILQMTGQQDNVTLLSHDDTATNGNAVPVSKILVDRIKEELH